MLKKISLSVVIPAYNEEKLIKDTLEKVYEYLSKNKHNWEIIVSNDGSTDQTSKIVNSFKRRKVRLVGNIKNQGKGNALKKGIINSAGDYVIFMDADLSVSLNNIDIFLKEFDKGHEVVIASRRIKGSKILVHQSPIRENMGRIFTLLTNIITGVNISDFTCGFKGFSKKAAKKIFANSQIDRWAYDAEIIFLAKKYGYKIKEVPISWVNRQNTRVKLNRVVLETLRDLFKIRVNDIKGKYGNF